MYLETKSSGEATQDTFLSAEALHITEPQRTALITVLGMMERGQIKEEQFDMSAFHCGTSHCIAGWGDVVAGKELFVGVRRTAALNELFYPPFICDDAGGNCTDPRRGALALRSYLTTGDSRWDLAMSAKLGAA